MPNSIILPTGRSIYQAAATLIETAETAGAEVTVDFNGVTLAARPDSCESDIVSQYWTAAADRALTYEAQCREEYDQLVEKVRDGTPLDSDQRMQVKQIEAVLGIPPEMSILGTPAA